MDCDFENADLICPKCRFDVGAIGGNASCRRNCPEAPPCYAGHELQKLVKRLGIDPIPGCKCNKHAAEMDRLGCDWCRRNLDMIVGWLREEAEERKAKYAEIQQAPEADSSKPAPVALPLALRLPFSATAARQMVLLAIRRAEQAMTRNDA